MQESIGTVDLDSLQDRSSLDPRIRRTIGFFDFGMFVGKRDSIFNEII